jgi:hypothetical protein
MKSSVAHRKRESKAATKSGAKSEISSKTFGGEMGKPGTQFEINGNKFIVLDKKQGKKRTAQCIQCKTEIRRDKAINHKH